jgi:hemerythrin-like domain-containing protein
MTTQPTAIKIIRDDHAALAGLLRSVVQLVDKGPGDEPERFFDVLRAMLFYLDEFPEKRHHPKESDLLFPKLVRKAPELMAIIQKLEAEHMQGEHRIRLLQQQLLAWELLGDSRRSSFVEHLRDYVRFYLDHMRIEEREILPAAQRVLDAAEWAEIDRAFEHSRDPLAGGVADPIYERLFTRIVLATPAPLGLGRELRRHAEES